MPSQRLVYCRSCWFPATKPGLTFDQSGLCRACQAQETRERYSQEEWDKREGTFSDLIRQAVLKGTPNFDVLVPVSGGKDSITQVVRAAQHGARVLAVCVDYGVKTAIGRQNLDAVPAIGDNVHLQVYRPPLRLHRSLMLAGLREYGDPDLFSHTLLHAYPLHQALALQVPLVVLGENSAAQYGGSHDLAVLPGMTREWFESYAVSGGHSTLSTAETLGFSSAGMRYYDFPDDLEESETKTVFMSAFYSWDSESHLRIAQHHGFRALDGSREGTFRNYVGIDEHINRIHQYLKLLKFGYGRTTDHVCEDIRLARLSRSDGRKLILEHELAPPSLEAMRATADFLEMPVAELAGIMEGFRNRQLWRPTEDGQGFTLPGFLEDSDSKPITPLTKLYGEVAAH
jgi:N-acetyl sugar amidotransferase